MVKKDIKVLYYDTDIICKDTIIWGLLENEIEVKRSALIAKLKYVDYAQVDIIAKESKQYDFVISQNFSLTIAEGCNISSVPYFSWIWDSPQVQLYAKQGFYNTNYVFAFDKMQVDRLKKAGLKNVWWQPLNANISEASQIIISEDDISRFSHDISLVGSCYKKEQFDETVTKIPIEYADELERIVNNETCKWGKYNSRIYNKLSNDLASYIISRMPERDFLDYSVNPRYIMETLLLSYELCHRDRRHILNELSKKYDVALFSGDKDLSFLSDTVKKYSSISYLDAYKVYYASKINLNITLPSIETGIPLRVFDIMAVGGCVFSNYQEEIEELFTAEKDIILFSSAEEMNEKVSYYLSHEKERINVGINGYLRVKSEYNVANAIKRIIEIGSEVAL